MLQVEDLVRDVSKLDAEKLKPVVHFAFDRFLTWFLRKTWQSILQIIDKAQLLLWLPRIFKSDMETKELMVATIEHVIEIYDKGDAEKASISLSTMAPRTKREFVETYYEVVVNKIERGRVWETIRHLVKFLLPPIELVKKALKEFKGYGKSLKLSRELVNTIKLMPDQHVLNQEHLASLEANIQRMEAIVAKKGQQPESEKYDRFLKN